MGERKRGAEKGREGGAGREMYSVWRPAEGTGSQEMKLQVFMSHLVHLVYVLETKFGSSVRASGILNCLHHPKQLFFNKKNVLAH